MKYYDAVRKNLSSDKSGTQRNRLIRFMRRLPCPIVWLCVVSATHASQDTLRFSLQFSPPYVMMSSPDGYVAAESRRIVWILSDHEKVETDWQVEETVPAVPARRVSDIALGGENTLFQDPDPDFSSFSQRVAGRDRQKYIIQIRVGSKYGIAESSGEWVSRGILTVKGENLIRLDRDRLDSVSDAIQTPMQSLKEPETDKRSFDQPPRGLKMWIGSEGMVEITRSEIEAAGWKNIRNIDPRYLQIIGTGGEVPLQFTGENNQRFDASDRIRFRADYAWENASSGHKRKDVFALRNIYWLKVGDRQGMRLAREDGGLPSASIENAAHSRSFPYTEHIEENRYFQRLADAATQSMGDHWFGSSWIVGGQQFDFPFHLKDPDIYSQDWAGIEVFCYGDSKILQIHEVDVYLNNRYVGGAEWQFVEPVLITGSRFPSSYLLDGRNVLTLVNRSPSGELSKLYFDWCKVTYPRLYSANSGRLSFAPPAGSSGRICRFTLEGFLTPDIHVFKNNISRLWNLEIRAVVDTLGQTTYQVQFHDEIPVEKIRYEAVERGRFLKPDSMVFVRDEDPFSGPGADYLIILPADSMRTDALENYMVFRRSQGLEVRAVTLETIYNHFSLGMPTPDAIRKLLDSARKNWNPAPRFILLAGNGDLQGQITRRSSSGALLPVPVVQTVQYGATPSDHWYVARPDDPVSDMAIGRWPVQSRSELDAVINKTLLYENSPAELWKNRILFIGARGASDVFRHQSEELIQKTIPPSLSPGRLYLTQTGENEASTDSLVQLWNRGLSLINFRGHGGGAIWADDGLFDLSDISRLENNGRLPVITSMTCFTADFAVRSASLGQSLLLAPETGAAAFWGSTGLGWVWNDFYLLRELLEIMTTEPGLTLGEAIMKAKRVYYLTYQGGLALSEIYQYTLLGDPALGFAFPEIVMNLDGKPRSLNTGGNITLTGQDGEGGRELSLEWTLPDRSPFSAEHRSVENNPWEQVFSIPRDFPSSRGGIRVYARDPLSDFQSRGYIDFTVNSAFFSDIGPYPVIPTHRDSLRFRVRAEEAGSIQSVRCVIQVPVKDTLEAEPFGPDGWYQTRRALAPVNPGTDIQYFFIAQNREGRYWESDEQTLRIPSLPNVLARQPDLSGTERVELETGIRNLGESAVHDLVVQFQVPSIGFTGSDTLIVAGGSTERARVPFPAPNGSFQVEIILDPDSNLTDVNFLGRHSGYTLKSDRFNVTHEKGSLNGTESGAWVGLDGVVLCRLAPGSVDDSSVLTTRVLNAQEAASVPQTGYPVMLVHLDDGFTKPNQPADLKWWHPEEDTKTGTGLYYWDRFLDRWTRVEGESGDSTFTARSNRLGLFSWLAANDDRAPLIEYYIGDQPLGAMSYVSDSPRFEIILQDESGVDIHSPQTKVMLNDQPQEFTAPDSTDDPSHMVITFQPKLSPGLHRMWISAADIHGNVTRTEDIVFQVSDRFALQYLGNYPNPFKIQTVFVYVLTDAADRVTLKIYTVAGKLIRVFDDPDMGGADYHEVVWDGTDSWGNPVANGVYFFSLKARGPRGQKEVTGKIAILR